MRKTRVITELAVLAALSVILVFFIHFPIFPSAPFLEYDPADIPILIGTFLLGPTLGFVLTVIASILQGITVSSGSGIIGIVMHIIATGSFAVVAGIIYKRNHTRTGAFLALCCGSVVMIIMMVILNLILTPIYMGTPIETVAQMIVPVIIPFNMIKAGINSLITFVVYKPLSNILKQTPELT